MREYVIYTDTSADFDANMIKELNIGLLPLSYTIDGVTMKNEPDADGSTLRTFYDKMRKGSTTSTSQINVTEFLTEFRKTLEAGKDILYLGFSSGLSGTVNSGAMAANELQEEFTGARVRVVDTLAASLGQGLLVWLAVQQKNQGKTLDEVGDWVEANKLNMAHWVTVEDLKYLKNGGRISAASAMLGTMLSIKPIIHVDNEGHLTVVEKVRGRKQSLNTVVDHMVESAIEPAGQTVFISHGDCLEDAEYVRDEVKRRMGVKNFYINYIGPVIGAHSGPGTLALFFLAAER